MVRANMQLLSLIEWTVGDRAYYSQVMETDFFFNFLLGLDCLNECHK